MDEINGNNNVNGVLNQLPPEPESSLGANVGAAALGLVGSLIPGLGIGSVTDPTLAGLLQTQLAAQKEMMVVSMVSNVEKSKHETQMAAVRNMRVG